MEASRDVLERHAHDGVIVKKLIGAMLADSASDGAASGACGESEFLKNQRSKFVRLFHGNMSDLATMGLDFMADKEF